MTRVWGRTTRIENRDKTTRGGGRLGEMTRGKRFGAKRLVTSRT